MASFAALVGRTDILDEARNRLQTIIIPTQIEPDGRQPLELAHGGSIGRECCRGVCVNPDLDVGPQHLQDARGQLFGDQDDGCGPRHDGCHGWTA